jgi:uncharacterized membrane protein YadS
MGRKGFDRTKRSGEIMETSAGASGLNESWRTKTLLIGAALGALVGVGGAYLLIQNADKRGEQVEVSSKKGLKLGLILLGLLRQVAQLEEGD